MMTTRMERLEAGQDQIAATILKIKEQTETRGQVRSQRRLSVRPYCARVRSAFVGAKERLPTKTRYWLTTLHHWVAAYHLIYGSKYLGLFARFLEHEWYLGYREKSAAKALRCRREAEWGSKTGRRILECLKEGGDIWADAALHEITEIFDQLPPLPSWKLRGGSF